MLNDTGNTLSYVRGDHKKVMYKPLSFEEMPEDKIKEIQNFCKANDYKFEKSRMSLGNIAKKFGVDWMTFKRIIFN